MPRSYAGHSFIQTIEQLFVADFIDLSTGFLKNVFGDKTQAPQPFVNESPRATPP